MRGLLSRHLSWTRRAEQRLAAVSWLPVTTPSVHSTLASALPKPFPLNRLGFAFRSARAGIIRVVVWLALILLAAPTPNALTVDSEGVRIDVRVHANVYAYDVSNTGTSPIGEFAVPCSDGHAFSAPDGWTVSTEDGLFRAAASESGRAIRRGQTGTFSFRTTTRGAALGFVDLHLGTVDGTGPAAQRVWGAVPTPGSYVMLLAGWTLALAGLLTVALNRADRRRPPTVTDL